ncbi:MAG: molybdopterin-binding protein [Spirochaeta sp.]|nr:molybdopterin-binding protein [Spirochaeta sp.]
MVAILHIGDEILSGSVREANLHLMLTTLGNLGYGIGEVRIVRDDRDEIAAAFRELREKYEYVLSAGGIGPTHDDITVESAVAAFDVPAEEHPEMRSFLESRYGTPLTPMVRKMAQLPRGTSVVGCSEGHWPVIRWDNVFILPGLPRALEDKMRRISEILPPRATVWSAELFLSADESEFADWLDTQQPATPGVSIGSYPVYGDYDYRSRLVVRGVDRPAVRALAARLREYVEQRGWLVRLGGEAEPTS